jgi:hypothetical protein
MREIEREANEVGGRASVALPEYVDNRSLVE